MEEQGAIYLFDNEAITPHFSSLLGNVEFQPHFQIIVASIPLAHPYFFFKQGRLQSTTSDKAIIDMMYVLRPPNFQFFNL